MVKFQYYYVLFSRAFTGFPAPFTRNQAFSGLETLGLKFRDFPGLYKA